MRLRKRTVAAENIPAYLACPFLFLQRRRAPLSPSELFRRTIQKAITACHRGPRPITSEELAKEWAALWKEAVKKYPEVHWRNRKIERQEFLRDGWRLLLGVKNGKHKGYLHHLTYPSFQGRIITGKLQIKTKIGPWEVEGVIDEVWGTRNNLTLVKVTLGSPDPNEQAVLMTAWKILAQKYFGKTPGKYFTWSLKKEEKTRVSPWPEERLKRILARIENDIRLKHFPKTKRESKCINCPYCIFCYRKEEESYKKRVTQQFLL